MCTGSSEKNMSICNTDSGSGLVFKNLEDNRYYVHGIASALPSIENETTCKVFNTNLYYKVSSYYQFIDTAINVFEMCTLPDFPYDGQWEFEKNIYKRPGDFVSPFDILKISCNEGFKLSMSNPYMDCESLLLNKPSCRPFLHLNDNNLPQINKESTEKIANEKEIAVPVSLSLEDVNQVTEKTEEMATPTTDENSLENDNLEGILHTTSTEGDLMLHTSSSGTNNIVTETLEEMVTSTMSSLDGKKLAREIVEISTLPTTLNSDTNNPVTNKIEDEIVNELTTTQIPETDSTESITTLATVNFAGIGRIFLILKHISYEYNYKVS